MIDRNNLFFGSDFNQNDAGSINFIETRIMDLSPFSAHEVMIDGITYKTAEHAYQALRVVAEVRVQIEKTGSPMDAWRAGQVCKERNQLLPNLDKYELMEKIFRAKLMQHADIEAVLKITGDRELLKVYPKDYYWGTGADGSGENMMGKLWMKLRAELILM